MNDFIDYDLDWEDDEDDDLWDSLFPEQELDYDDEFVCYFKFVNNTYCYLRRLDAGDPDHPLGYYLRVIEKIRDCKFNPNKRFAHPIHWCRKCLKCQWIISKKRLRLLYPSLPTASSSSPHLSICLQQPQVCFDDDRTNVLGEKQKTLLGKLLYVPASLSTDLEISTRHLVSGYRREAFESIKDCFPDLILGGLVSVHLDDRFMNFSPHIHAVLCGTGLLKKHWPLQRVDNSFPDLKKSWRSLIGRKFGKKAFIHLLKEKYAERLSSYVVNYLKRLRSSLRTDIDTGRYSYACQFVCECPDLDAFGEQIRQAVLDDPNTVYVGSITIDVKSGEQDPEVGLQNSIKYGVSGPTKDLTFRKSDNGPFIGAYTKDKKGKWKPCGTLYRQFDQFIKLHSVTYLRRYEKYGYIRSNWGKEKQHALRLAMSKGYPR